MQTRLGSLIEAATNVFVGYLVALMTQLLVFPAFGLQVSLGENLAIGLVFTVVSLSRSYLLRRLFNRRHRHDAESISSARRSTIITAPGGIVRVQKAQE